MGVMDSEELDRLRGVPITDLADIEPDRKMAECLACGETFPDDDVESDYGGAELCPRCHSDRLRKLDGTA